MSKSKLLRLALTLALTAAALGVFPVKKAQAIMDCPPNIYTCGGSRCASGCGTSNFAYCNQCITSTGQIIDIQGYQCRQGLTGGYNPACAQSGYCYGCNFEPGLGGPL